jgi:hypothetical protein
LISIRLNCPPDDHVIQDLDIHDPAGLDELLGYP